MRKLWKVVGAFVLVVAAIEVLLPFILSALLAQGMANLTGVDRAAVMVSKRPAVLMLGGAFDKIAVNAESVKTDKIILRDFRAELEDAQLDMGALLTRKVVVLSSARAAKVQAAVTQEELAHFLNTSVRGIKNARVTIIPDKVEAAADFSLGGFANISLVLQGRMIGEGTKIKFVTERILVNGLASGNLTMGTLAEIPIADLKSLPFNVHIREVDMEAGRVVLHADNLP